MKYFGYLFFRFFVLFFSILPFRIIYLLADFAFFLLYKVFKYRRELVRQNLNNSFPDKSKQEIDEIELNFYHNLADISIESIKGMSLSEKQLKHRYKVINPEVLQKIYDRGVSVIGVGSHYANWEWGVLSFSLQFPHKCYGLYKPIKNKYIDKYLKKGRAQTGMYLYPMKETRQLFEEEQDRPRIYIMVADQSPTKIKKAHWVNFLNQDTACLPGVDFYTRNNNLPVIYGNVQRIKRGFYEVSIDLLITEDEKIEEGDVTRLIMNHLEEIIRKKPEDWLWSHRRWKHRKQI